jgi:hypothetical protein
MTNDCAFTTLAVLATTRNEDGKITAFYHIGRKGLVEFSKVATEKTLGKSVEIPKGG